MKEGSFKVPIYGFEVFVVIVEDQRKTTEYYHKLHKKFKRESSGDEACEGFMFMNNLQAWVAISEKHLTYSTITHEISHLTFRILNFNGIFEGKDNEYFALLNGYLNEEVFKIINKLSCKIITT